MQAISKLGARNGWECEKRGSRTSVWAFRRRVGRRLERWGLDRAPGEVVGKMERNGKT